MTLIMKQRKVAFRYSIIPQQTFAICNHLIGHNLPEGKEMSRKIQALSDPKKDFISEMFIILAKLDFRIKFLNWFVKNKVDEDTDQGEDKVKEVQHSIS